MTAKDNTTPELKDCPFCGRKAKVDSIDDGRFYTVGVKHKKSCYMADNDPAYYYSIDRGLLVSQWNRRA